MNGQATIESLIERLLLTLDHEAEHLGRVTEYLTQLSRLILKRDEQGLQELLDQARLETLSKENYDAQRHSLVASIASAIGCQVPDVTLSMLERVAPEYRHPLQQKRTHMRKLVEDLRMQHYSTTMLLGEMIRINRSLLAGITGGTGGVTYGRGGRTKWAGAENILNLKY
jgi:hypothetical protein